MNASAIDLKQVTETLKRLKHFVPESQLRTMYHCAAKGEESEYFREQFIRLDGIVQTMAKTYEQEGKGDDAIVYLHYFGGSCDWYITERDSSDEQLQAYGYANLGHGSGDFGYISIQEGLKFWQLNVDLHFEPCTIGELKQQGKIES